MGRSEFCKSVGTIGPASQTGPLQALYPPITLGGFTRDGCSASRRARKRCGRRVIYGSDRNNICPAVFASSHANARARGALARLNHVQHEYVARTAIWNAEAFILL